MSAPARFRASCRRGAAIAVSVFLCVLAGLSACAPTYEATENGPPRNDLPDGESPIRSPEPTRPADPADATPACPAGDRDDGVLPSGDAGDAGDAARPSCSHLGANVARCALARASSTFGNPRFSAAAAIDGLLGTSWYSSSSACDAGACDGESVYLDVVFDAPRTLGRVVLRGNRDFPTGFDVLSARVVLMDGTRRVLTSTDVTTTRGAEPNGDAEWIVSPPVSCVARVRVIVIRAEGAREPGLAEVEAYLP